MNTIKINKDKNYTMAYVNIPNEIVEQLNQIAEKEYTTITTIVRTAIIQHLRDREIKLSMHKAYLDGMFKYEQLKGELK